MVRKSISMPRPSATHTDRATTAPQVLVGVGTVTPTRRDTASHAEIFTGTGSLPLCPLKNLRRLIQKEVEGKKQSSRKSFGEKVSLTVLKTSFSALLGEGETGNHSLCEPSFPPL